MQILQVDKMSYSKNLYFTQVKGYIYPFKNMPNHVFRHGYKKHA